MSTLAFVIVAACTGREGEIARDHLPLACQTLECECVEEQSSLFSRPRKADIVWDARGRPGCPAGFRLRRVEKDIFGNPRK